MERQESQQQRGRPARVAGQGFGGRRIGTIILVVLYALLGGDPSAIIGNLQSNNSQISTPIKRLPRNRNCGNSPRWC